VKLGSKVVIERGCNIGESVIIEHNVVIHSGTSIGANTRIRANTSLGGDGFGFDRDEYGEKIYRFQHLGGLIIGCNVEIGSNNCIAKGTLSNTIIEDNVKTDNLVHIAHNCHIKKGVIITACSELSGGVVVGENAWLGPNSSIIQKVSIGKGAFVGIGAVVTKPIEENYLYAGNPAKKIKKL
jgi:UDP-3-O-[3-hydroxymyristoyl] glucosamine N-acyltransferase